MNIQKIEFKESVLKFESVLIFFNEVNTVLNVTIVKKGKYVVDYEKIKKHLPKVSERPNIYGIYTKKENKKWELKYIGQRKNEAILQRLKNHLNSENEGTQSKYKEVQKALKENEEVGIKLFSIRPDSMRLYYEERLISELCQNNWNQQKHK